MSIAIMPLNPSAPWNNPATLESGPKVVLDLVMGGVFSNGIPH